MRISDWSSDVCSSDLELVDGRQQQAIAGGPAVEVQHRGGSDLGIGHAAAGREEPVVAELVLATGTPRRAQDRQLALTGPYVAGAPERAPDREHAAQHLGTDRHGVVYGKSGSVRVDIGGRRSIKKKRK